MNKNELTKHTILYVIAITMLSAVAFVFVASTELTQNAVGQAEEVFNENATFIQEIEGGSPTATANQTGEAVQSGVNQTGEAVQSGVNQTGEAITNASKSNVVQNISQGAQEIGQTTAKESGDIFGSISEAFKGLFGMK
jgi:predicted PurR-regulated permease PerM